MQAAELYLCGTPIGNLDDVSQRLLATLKEVDLIACEDTRRTQKLLNYFSIKTKMISYHEHNEKERSKELIEYLQAGRKIALVSDAGMPGVSDPGEILVKKAVSAGIEVIPIPGPSAFLAALVVSGLDISAFSFKAFIPRSGKKRQQFLEELALAKDTTAFYESPYRLKDTLKDLSQFSSELASRQAVVAREITKMHEEKYYGTVAELEERLKEQEIKGEIVVVIAGRSQVEAESEGWEDLSILEHLKLLIESGMTKKQAIKKVANLRELPKSEVYKEAVVISVDKDKFE
ncbi:16S rRNA (cytidine1402-2'-O)-methyltransferase [Halanaerobium saccharolyticum]|uniref:Ribosomal RNA small subunit methyltransferase I n=1 Tax=Halanaerobium saccharolyticum TaxID=43595 RepID=A0A4V6PTR8_9FIRM|nr:16S rRNA (cytidine(1402)-2'-O)-methyltransferase [Halanaerobium saccharolyticum]TDO95032.1 16S rRNA (cytidine1402-2'-O)-methyltransferase [Halanaerobium saccharolyticum]